MPDPIGRLHAKHRLTQDQVDAARSLQAALRRLGRPEGSPLTATWLRQLHLKIGLEAEPLAWEVLEAIVVKGHPPRSPALGGMRSERVERLLCSALDVVAADPPPA